MKLVLAALALALVPIAAAAPAGAAAPKTTCIESHVSKAWHVATEVRRWNAAGAHLRLSRNCGKAGIPLRLGNLARGVTGQTMLYSSRPVDVTVDAGEVARFARANRDCLRSYTIGHELGHVLGLRHYPKTHSGAVMSYQGWWLHCGRITKFDRQRLAAVS